jgi:hypothetical protein
VRGQPAYPSIESGLEKALVKTKTDECYPAFDYLRISLAPIVIAAPGHAGLISWENSGNYAVQVFWRSMDG